MRNKWIWALVFSGALAGMALNGQGISEDEYRWGSRPYVPQPSNAIRVQTSLVQVPVVVRDSNGKAIGGLKKSDFELYDSGHQVEISSFSVENAPTLPLQDAAASQVLNATQPPAVPAVVPPPAPRYIALFFDDTSMRVFDVVATRKAAESFVRTNLKPDDRIGIFTTSTTVSLDFTDNVPKLLATIGQLETHRRQANTAGSRCPPLNPYQAYLITLNLNAHSDAFDLALHEGCGDAHEIINAAQETLALAEQFSQDTLGIITDVVHYLGRMPGHRMIVFASSGFLTQTLAAKQNKVIDEALNANVIINSLDAKGLVAEVPGYDEDGQPIRLSGKWEAIYDRLASDNREYQNDPLALLAEGTGGRFYHNRNDLDIGLREMAARPDASYVLSFSPVDLKANGAAHDLKVKVPSIHGASIQARRGYMAPSPTPTESEKKQRKLDNAVLATDEQSNIPMHVMTETGALATGESTLKVAVHVDVAKLPFQEIGSRKVERLIFVTVLFDEQNHFLAGVQGVMDLNLKKETLAAISSSGLDAKLSLHAPPGNYRLRQVVEEVADGRITAISRPVGIR